MLVCKAALKARARDTWCGLQTVDSLTLASENFKSHPAILRRSPTRLASQDGEGMLGMWYVHSSPTGIETLRDIDRRRKGDCTRNFSLSISNRALRIAGRTTPSTVLS